jgi:hypothetical protein
VHYARYHLRAVAFSYGLLGILALACAVTLISLNRHLGTVGGISAEATPLAIYVGAGITFCALAWLSLRYPVLTPGWAILTLALSVLLSLCGLGCTLKVSLTGWGTLLGTVVWWALALTCSVCSYLLWGQRRASNNRSKGRDA